MTREWVLFDKDEQSHSKARMKGMTASIAKCAFTFSAEVFRAMGEPTLVHVYIDKPGRRFAVQLAEPGDRDAYHIQRASKSSQSRKLPLPKRLWSILGCQRPNGIYRVTVEVDAEGFLTVPLPNELYAEKEDQQ